MEKVLGKSWQTTLGGIIQFVIVGWGQFQLLLDNDVVTNPDYNLLVASFITLIALFKARDNNKSSEEVGAK